MAKVFDVPADIFISRLTQILKNEDIPVPDFASFVKTGSHAEKPPKFRMVACKMCFNPKEDLPSQSSFH